MGETLSVQMERSVRCGPQGTAPPRRLDKKEFLWQGAGAVQTDVCPAFRHVVDRAIDYALGLTKNDLAVLEYTPPEAFPVDLPRFGGAVSSFILKLEVKRSVPAAAPIETAAENE
jgi:hypothetical protein